MSKLGGGGALVVGIFLIIGGWLIQSAILEWLLDITGFIIIVAGVILGVYGLVKMFSGDKGTSSDF